MASDSNNLQESNRASFAIIETGGKQYRVRKGDVIRVEKLEGKEGDSVTFDKVLLASGGKEAKLGEPYLNGARVLGKITLSGRGKKIEVMKYKAKSRYKKVRGHRQPYMLVSIESIQ